MLCVLLMAGLRPAFTQEPDARLNAFFKDYLEEQFRQQPLEATRLGDHRVDHLLDDVSRQARDGWTAHDRKALEELPKQVDYSKLSRGGQIDFDIFRTNWFNRSGWRRISDRSREMRAFTMTASATALCF
jgi:uncharacterized protein (DUF885 family)